MKPSKLIFVIIVSCLIAWAPFIIFGQTIEDIVEPKQPAQSDEEFDAYTLIKTMILQVIKSPASLLVIVGLSVIAAVMEAIKICPSDPIRVILPVCTLGGAAFYWCFAPAASVDKAFPHPHAVFIVNGLVCGFVAFLLHSKLVLLLIEKRRQEHVCPPQNPS